FRIARTLQDFLVHLPIAHPAAAVSAGGIHHNFTRHFSGWLQLQDSLLQFERSMYRVEHIPQRELDGCLSRIHLERLLLSRCRNCKQQEHSAESEDDPSKREARSAGLS